MALYEVPLTATPQTLSLVIGSTSYRLSVSWCAPAGYWLLDFADEDGTPIVQGIPLIAGADLLAQYSYLGIGAKMIALSDGDLLTPPTFDTLGTTGHLLLEISE
jgi:hypothetical protein